MPGKKTFSFISPAIGLVSLESWISDTNHRYQYEYAYQGSRREFMWWQKQDGELTSFSYTYLRCSCSSL